MNRWRENAINLLTLSMSAALVVTGYLLGLIVAKDFLYAVFLVLVVALLASGISSWFTHRSEISLASTFDANTRRAITELMNAFQSSFTSLDKKVDITLKSVERAVYDYLATFNPGRNLAQLGTSEITILTKEQAAAIEASAEEVWVYAHNMTWDVDEGGFGTVLEDNLREAARYRFIIPDHTEVKNRVRVLYARWHRIPDLQSRVTFRVRQEELLFAKFSINIYNPTYEKASEERENLHPCVILFPIFNRPGPVSYDPFIKLTGPIVSDYEVEFSQVWQAASKYTPEPLESE